MPTPFTHLIKARALLDDSSVSDRVKQFLREQWGAFLLGNIVPDAHHMVPSREVQRVTTHFFDYGPVVDPPAGQVMLTRFPELKNKSISDPQQMAFVAGYLAHLAVDEVWAVEVVYRFIAGNWLERRRRHFAFTTLLALMDGRDYSQISHDYHHTLSTTTPQDWLPFLPDYAIIAWRDRIAAQIKPGGQPETLHILGRTVYSGYEDLLDMINQPERLESELWRYFPQSLAAEKEQLAYDHMRTVIENYLQPKKE